MDKKQLAALKDRAEQIRQRDELAIAKISREVCESFKAPWHKVVLEGGKIREA